MNNVPTHPGRVAQQGLGAPQAAQPTQNPYHTGSPSLEAYNARLAQAQTQQAYSQADKANAERALIEQSQGLGSPVEGGPEVTPQQIQAEQIANEVSSVLGEVKDASTMQSLLDKQIEANRTKTEQTLLTIIASNVENLSKFNREITANYYRKSLELKLKSIYLAKETISSKFFGRRS